MLAPVNPSLRYEKRKKVGDQFLNSAMRSVVRQSLTPRDMPAPRGTY